VARCRFVPSYLYVLPELPDWPAILPVGHLWTIRPPWRKQLRRRSRPWGEWGCGRRMDAGRAVLSGPGRRRDAARRRAAGGLAGTGRGSTPDLSQLGRPAAGPGRPAAAPGLEPALRRHRSADPGGAGRLRDRVP